MGSAPTRIGRPAFLVTRSIGVTEFDAEFVTNAVSCAGARMPPRTGVTGTAGPALTPPTRAAYGTGTGLADAAVPRWKMSFTGWANRSLAVRVPRPSAASIVRSRL